jgi:hypothetical protein
LARPAAVNGTFAQPSTDMFIEQIGGRSSTDAVPPSAMLNVASTVVWAPGQRACQPGRRSSVERGERNVSLLNLGVIARALGTGALSSSDGLRTGSWP